VFFGRLWYLSVYFDEFYFHKNIQPRKYAKT